MIAQRSSNGLGQQAPTAAPVVPQSTPGVGPFNFPKWVNVALGGTMIGVGLYTAAKPQTTYVGGSFQDRTEISVPKNTVDLVAAGGSVVGGIYIIMDALGYKF